MQTGFLMFTPLVAQDCVLFTTKLPGKVNPTLAFILTHPLFTSCTGWRTTLNLPPPSPPFSRGQRVGKIIYTPPPPPACIFLTTSWDPADAKSAGLHQLEVFTDV